MSAAVSHLTAGGAAIAGVILLFVIVIPFGLAVYYCGIKGGQS